jgi:hypothetical protein
VIGMFFGFADLVFDRFVPEARIMLQQHAQIIVVWEVSMEVNFSENKSNL